MYNSKITKIVVNFVGMCVTQPIGYWLINVESVKLTNHWLLFNILLDKYWLVLPNILVPTMLLVMHNYFG